MTGTANELIDHNDNTVLNSSNFELFSAWLFGNINANCIINDISHCGCSILVPKYKSVPAETFNLLIMSPDNDKELHTVVSAQPRWSDKKALSTHVKTGVKFLNINADTREQINDLIRHITLSNSKKIKCSLLKK